MLVCATCTGLGGNLRRRCDVDKMIEDGLVIDTRSRHVIVGLDAGKGLLGCLRIPVENGDEIARGRVTVVIGPSD